MEPGGGCWYGLSMHSDTRRSNLPILFGIIMIIIIVGGVIVVVFLGKPTPLNSNQYFIVNPAGNMGVEFANGYGSNNTGYANVTNFSIFSGINFLPLTFNVTGLEKIQRNYNMTVNAYGNGSLSILFRGISPFSIIKSTSATASYNGGIETITYTKSEVSQLEVVYS